MICLIVENFLIYFNYVCPEVIIFVNNIMQIGLLVVKGRPKPMLKLPHI